MHFSEIKSDLTARALANATPKIPRTVPKNPYFA